jgi:hypothetical protein
MSRININVLHQHQYATSTLVSHIKVINSHAITLFHKQANALLQELQTMAFGVTMANATSNFNTHLSLQPIEGSTDKDQGSKEGIQAIFYAVSTSSIAYQQEVAEE